MAVIMMAGLVEIDTGMERGGSLCCDKRFGGQETGGEGDGACLYSYFQ